MELTKIQIVELDYFTMARFFTVLYGISGIFAGFYYAIESNSSYYGLPTILGYPVFSAFVGLFVGFIITFLFNTLSAITGGIEIYAEIGIQSKEQSEGEY